MTLFGKVCVAIWGEDFSGVAADTLQVNRRNVQHWSAGSKDVPPGIMGELSIILLQAINDTIDRYRALQSVQRDVEEEYAKGTFNHPVVTGNITPIRPITKPRND